MSLPLFVQTNLQIMAEGLYRLVAGIDSTGKPRLLKVGNDGTLAVSASFSGAQRTPTIADINAGGTIAAGARGLTFVFSADFVGSILGSAVSGANLTSMTIPVPSGDTLGAVIYTVSAGTMQAIVVS